MILFTEEMSESMETSLFLGIRDFLIRAIRALVSQNAQQKHLTNLLKVRFFALAKVCINAEKWR